MTDLLLADLERILWRPLSRAVALLAALIIVASAVVVFVRTQGPHPFDPQSGVRTALLSAAAPLALTGFTVGAAALGADYSSRALTTLLTWEPRRLRVLASRATAAATVTLAASLAAQLLLIGALAPAALVNGTNTTTPARWLPSIAWLGLRCALLAAALAAMGVALAAIARSTTTAVVAAAAYLILVERTAVGVLPSLGRWLLLSDSIAWVTAEPGIHVAGPSGTAPAAAAAGLILLVILLALCALAGTIFTRRDIA